MNFELRENTILLTISGSRAYGINTPDSDVDCKGVFITPLEHYIGMPSSIIEKCDNSERIAEFLPFMNDKEIASIRSTKLEGVVYDIRKFVSLAANSNPNIIDVLFCRDDEIRVCSDIGRKLRENRELFISQKVKDAYLGYALSNLKRIRTHREWLLNPPSAKPKRSDFGLSEHNKALSEEHLRALEFMINSGFDFSLLGVSESILEELHNERKYQKAKIYWDQFQNWKKTRNEARSALEEKYLYDTKHAAHLVRLLRMGKEIMLTGCVNVWRGGIDSDELLAIRNGVMKYDDLLQYADDVIKDFNGLSNSDKCNLQVGPDFAAINNLCISMVIGHNK